MTVLDLCFQIQLEIFPGHKSNNNHVVRIITIPWHCLTLRSSSYYMPLLIIDVSYLVLVKLQYHFTIFIHYFEACMVHRSIICDLSTDPHVDEFFDNWQVFWWVFWQIFSTNFFDEFFWQIFLTNFFDKFFDELFWRIFLTNFLTYNLLTIASFRIGVPLILYSCHFQYPEKLSNLKSF